MSFSEAVQRLTSLCAVQKKIGYEKGSEELGEGFDEREINVITRIMDNVCLQRPQPDRVKGRKNSGEFYYVRAFDGARYAAMRNLSEARDLIITVNEFGGSEKKILNALISTASNEVSAYRDNEARECYIAGLNLLNAATGLAQNGKIYSQVLELHRLF